MRKFIFTSQTLHNSILLFLFKATLLGWFCFLTLFIWFIRFLYVTLL